jgi:3-oxoadipate enol-lactonase
MSDGAPVELAAGMAGPPGAPILVLGSSLGTTSQMWEPQLGALRGRFRVLRYEHRGHGGSPAPPGPYAIADLGRDVLALLDEYEVGSAHYCGLSLGGMVGVWLAAHAPARIGRLVLCCTSAFLEPLQLWRDRAAAVRSGGTAPLSAQVVGRWFTPGYRSACPGTVARFEATLTREVVPEGYAGCCDAIAGMDLRPLLPTVTAPTLVLAGAEDPATPPWHGAVLASGIPGARLRVLRGVSHLANVASPAEFTAALLGHLAG